MKPTGQEESSIWDPRYPIDHGDKPALAQYERLHPAWVSMIRVLGAKLTRYGSGTMALILRDQSAAVRDTNVIAKLHGINGAMTLAMIQNFNFGLHNLKKIKEDCSC